MALHLSPPSSETDILPSVLHRYFAPKSPSRPWLIRQSALSDRRPSISDNDISLDDDLHNEIEDAVQSLRGVDISHAYTTTCTAIDGVDRSANDLRVMHRMDDGFALGTAAALNDKFLPYSKDPIAGATDWAPMKWRRFAADLKEKNCCEYIEVGETENGKWILTAFLIKEGPMGSIGMNADVLYFNDGSVLRGSKGGKAIVEGADMRVCLRDMDEDGTRCRFCKAWGDLKSCECPARMRKSCGQIHKSAAIDPKGTRRRRSDGFPKEDSSVGIVSAQGSSGLTLWDRFLERQRALDRIATVRYTVYKQNAPIFVGPFALRLVYGGSKDTRKIAPVFLQRTTNGFRWARASPVPCIEAAEVADEEEKYESLESIGLAPLESQNVSNVPEDNDIVIKEIPESLCGSSTCNESTSAQMRCMKEMNGYSSNNELLSSIVPQPTSIASDPFGNNQHQQGVESHVQQNNRANNGMRDRRFACDQCDSAFITKGHLSRHCQSVHVKKPTLQCHFCDREFRDEAFRSHHMAVVHTDRRRTDGAIESEFRCELCGFAFVRKYTLLRHIKLVHDKQRVHCPLCKRQFGQKCDLKRHVIRVHGGEGLDKVSKAEITKTVGSGSSVSRAARSILAQAPTALQTTQFALE